MIMNHDMVTSLLNIFHLNTPDYSVCDHVQHLRDFKN